jgi:hypothetical protein
MDTASIEPVVTTHTFSSLYDSLAGTVAAIAFGLAVVVIVQVLVNRIFARAKSMIEALTFFATSMVAFLVAVYLCDLLIAGPDALLLREGERSAIVSFVQDICLMVFAYFFGTKSANDATKVSSESAASPVPMDLREDPPVSATPQTSTPARVSVGKA